MDKEIISLNKIFKKEEKILKKEKKLKKKLDIMYNKKVKIAYYLYQSFIQNNINTFDVFAKYYRIYIESDYHFMAEELIFKENFQDFIVFKHSSPYRQNQEANMPLKVEFKNYEVSSAIIDENQFLNLSKNFKITIRE